MVAMSISLSSESVQSEPLAIGRIFTPVVWARWCLEEFKIYERWRNNASIIDPTCGNGSFYLALFEIAREQDEPVTESDLLRLTVIELNKKDKSDFLHRSYFLRRI